MQQEDTDSSFSPANRSQLVSPQNASLDYRFQRKFDENQSKTVLLSNGQQFGESQSEPIPLHDKGQQIIAIVVMVFYVLLSICLLLAAFFTQSLFLLPVIPLIAREWAYAFHKAIDVLLTTKKE